MADITVTCAMRSAQLVPNLSMPSSSSAWEETDFRNSRSFSTRFSFFIRRWTSIMSAMIRSRVTADSRLLEARTMLPSNIALLKMQTNNRF